MRHIIVECPSCSNISQQKKKQMLIKYVCTTSRSIIDLILPSKTQYTVNQFDLNLKTSFHAIPLNNGQHIY
jgi:hypothetical protein